MLKKNYFITDYKIIIKHQLYKVNINNSDQ